MIRSIWRYSHLILAVSSSIFLLLAAVTGAILAVEPISQATKSYNIAGLNEIPVHQAISGIRSKHEEVLELEVTPSNYVIASVLTEDFENKNIYINPHNFSELGPVEVPSDFFNFITTFHRSLFLKSTGRIFVGIVSFLLCLIAVTGLLLLVKRQGGLPKLFNKVRETDFNQRYHVIFGRWLLVPIIIISATGIYLSAEKFELIPSYSVKHGWDESTIDKFKEEVALKDFPALRNVHLDEVRKIVFPFSEAPEDFYRVQLDDQEMLVHQFSGEVVSEQKYPFVQLASMLSIQLHTGAGNPLWAFVLLISSGSILFFIYSGFAMTLATRSRVKKEGFGTTNKDEAEYIVLVGSETGTTLNFANQFCESLENQNKLVHLSSLNEYATYEKARKMVVFTATYGDGDAPASARDFQKSFDQIQPINKMEYAVVGFGSMLYPNYCSYAEEISEKFKNHSFFEPVIDLTKINEQSFEEFRGWANNWGAKENLPVHLELKEASEKKDMISEFRVSEITELNEDETFLLKLKPIRKTIFQSGDLIGITPPKVRRERLYSIAKINGNILLSIKKHELGKCSAYLSNLQVGESLKGSIEKNQKFHLPKKAAKVIMICNGTGIAPFLGMVSKSHQADIHLFWGGRTTKSFELYKPPLEKALKNRNMKSFKAAFSREHPGMYVQDLLLEQTEFLIDAIESGAIFMICGSITMQNGVLEVLEGMLEKFSELKLSDMEVNEQIRLDCY